MSIGSIFPRRYLPKNRIEGAILVILGTNENFPKRSSLPRKPQLHAYGALTLLIKSTISSREH
jgi:hypothetical protein